MQERKARRVPRPFRGTVIQRLTPHKLLHLTPHPSHLTKFPHTVRVAIAGEMREARRAGPRAAPMPSVQISASPIGM